MSSFSGRLTDSDLARLLLEEGVLGEATLQECLVEVERRRQGEPAFGLSRLLVERRLVQAAVLADLLARRRGGGTLAEGGGGPSRLAQRFGEYEVVRLLAKGGMGAVYEATDPAGRKVAVKTILAGKDGADRELLERFRQEAELLGRLEHPHVVGVHAADLQAEVPYIVQDLLTGESLQARLDRRGALDLELALEVAIKLGRALEHAHERGVLHRDLKPLNVIFDEREEPRLVDFGLARDVDARSLTLSGTFVGTPIYMAPEQARGDRHRIDGRTDVYGLGAVLYAMLTGSSPFSREGKSGMVEILEMVIREPPPPPSELRPTVPRGVEAVVLKAMRKEAGQRYADMASFVDDLERCLAGEDPLRDGPPAWVIPAAAVGAGAAVVFAVLAFALGGGSPPPQLPPKPTPRPAPVAPAAPEHPAWFTALPRDRRARLPLPAGISFGERSGEFVNEIDGSILVYVPAATFRMGSTVDDPDGAYDERPEHEVRLTQGYFIGKYEVTWEQFRRFCTASGMAVPSPPEAGFTREPRHPACAMVWSEARAYCAWAGLRLPSEAEWEYAARGGDFREYPWGNEFAPREANFATGDGYTFTSPVGAFPRDVSPFGCFDMAGNVREWTADGHVPYGDGTKRIDPAAKPGGLGFVVGRGGDWRSPRKRGRCANRLEAQRDMRVGWLGMRVARDQH